MYEIKLQCKMCFPDLEKLKKINEIMWSFFECGYALVQSARRVSPTFSWIKIKQREESKHIEPPHLDHSTVLVFSL